MENRYLVPRERDIVGEVERETKSAKDRAIAATTILMSRDLTVSLELEASVKSSPAVIVWLYIFLQGWEAVGSGRSDCQNIILERDYTRQL